MKAYEVWDAPTRWFHWINALSVIALAGVGFLIMNDKTLGVSTAGKIALKTTHVWIGYVFVLNLAWRFIWAFFGNRYARWREIIPGEPGYLRALRSYVASFIAGNPEHYVGHNPLGRIGVAALFLLITIQAITGLVLAGTDLFYPPFGSWIATWVAARGVDPNTLAPYAPEMYDKSAWDAMRAFRAPIVETHEIAFYVLLVTAALHVTAVIMTELREGGAIISAMFTGRKIFAERPRDDRTEI
jgi:cytochrome b